MGGERLITACKGGRTKSWYTSPAVIAKAFRYKGEIYLPQARHPGREVKICCVRVSDGSHQDLDSQEAGRLHGSGKLGVCVTEMEVLAWASR